MKKYYDIPVQVRFYDEENQVWNGGIAYKDEIICGCCGGIVEIDELKEEYIKEYNNWIDISMEITGDDH